MDLAAARRVITPVTKSLCDCEAIHSRAQELRCKFQDTSPILISACSYVANLSKNFARILHLVLDRRDPFVDALEDRVDAFSESISHTYFCTLNEILDRLKRFNSARSSDAASIARLEQSLAVPVRSLKDRIRETESLINILELSEETRARPEMGNGGRSADYEAAFKRGQKDACEKLFDLGLLNQVVSNVTPLMRSIVKRDEEGVGLLLMAGADPHQPSVKPDESSSTQFLPICAAASGPASIVDVLIQHGADPLQRQPDGFNAIHIAAKLGQKPTLKLLLGLDRARLETKTTGASSGGTPLMVAVNDNRSSNYQCLVGMGADVNATDDSGTTALHHAARKGIDHAVSFLIQKNADIDPKNSEGNTPLMEAVEAGHSQTVDLLLTNGANGDVRNKKNMTPLLIAIVQSGKLDTQTNLTVATRLIEHRVLLENPALDYWPLSEAARAGDASLVKLLLSQRVSPNICPRDASGAKPPLYEAVERNAPEIVDCLRTAGASYAIMNGNCEHALVTAIQNGWSSLLQVLLCSFSINDTPGGAIATAVVSNQISLIPLLKHHGANLEAHDERGLRPLHLAVEMQHLEAVKMLIAEGVEPRSRTLSGKCGVCVRSRRTQSAGLSPRCVLHNIPKDKHRQSYKDIENVLLRAEGPH